MVNKTDLLTLNTLAKLECEMLDEILSNPNLSNDEIENLLLALKSISNEINSRINKLT